VSVLLGIGDGTFAPAVSYPTANGAHFIAVGDFNGDGTPDLAVSNGSSNSVSILLGNGDGTFRPASTFAVGNYPGFIETADFNGAGIPDLAVTNELADSLILLCQLRHPLGFRRI